MSAKTEEGKSFDKIGKGLGKFFRSYMSEFKKIVWPTRKQVVNNTLITIAMVLIVGAFIWLLDFGLGVLLNFIYSMA